MRTLAYLAVCGLILAVTGTAGAVTYTLDDLNSSASVDTSTGMYAWTVDGVSQLWRQNFYYRIGDATGLTNMASLPLTGSKAVDANFNPGDDTLNLAYAGAGLAATISYTLTGFEAGSSHSDIGELISVKNTSGSAISLHFYQYVDLDLAGTPDDDTARIVDGRVAQQFDPFFTVSETVVTPAPSRYQVALYDHTDVPPATLTDVAGPLTGDVTWAFEWDVTLGAGGVLAISKDKAISPAVPEPLTMLGVFAGISGVGAYIRKRAA